MGGHQLLCQEPIQISEIKSKISKAVAYALNYFIFTGRYHIYNLVPTYCRGFTVEREKVTLL